MGEPLHQAAVVEFHTGMPNALHYTCRLLRKAYQQGSRVAVMAPAPTLAALDTLLWTFEQGEFVPHVALTAGATEATLRRTPVWLAGDWLRAPQWQDAPEVFVNLGLPLPSEPVQGKRLIEVVCGAADDAQAGRIRWRQYVAQGVAVKHHNKAVS